MGGDSVDAVETGFEYRGSARSVSLAGSWAGWTPQPMSRAGGDSSAWALRVALPRGRAAFKFVVDGEWVAAGEYPVEDDGHGGENCIVHVGGEANGAGETGSSTGSGTEGDSERDASKEEQPGCVVM